MDFTLIERKIKSKQFTRIVFSFTSVKIYVGFLFHLEFKRQKWAKSVHVIHVP